MTIKPLFKKTLLRALLLTLSVNLNACGFFLYPERVGQKGGDIDASILILDGAGLLFGIVPGVAAFVIDISTGAIYLRPGEKSAIDKHRPQASIHQPLINRSHTAAQLEVILGQPVDASALQFFYQQHALVTVQGDRLVL